MAPQLLKLIVLGDGGYCGMGYVMAHQLVKLQPLQGCVYQLNMSRIILGDSGYRCTGNVMIILGDGGHCGTGCVMAPQLLNL